MRFEHVLLLAAALAIAPKIPCAAAADDEPARDREPVSYGRDLYEAWCSNCHSAEQGQNAFAPALTGLFGRKSGSVAGYPYSPLITSLELTWSPATLEAWLAGLSTESPTTSIRHVGVGNPKDRAALIAYLATLRPE